MNENPIIRDYFLEETRPEYEPRYTMGDVGIGYLFADWSKGFARFCPQKSCWFVYDGAVWKEDTENLLIAEYAKRFYVHLADYADNLERADCYGPFVNRAHNLHNRNRRDVMIKDAKSVHPVTLEEFDRDPYLFNVANGTFDFHPEMMKFKEHDPEDLLTKMSPVVYDSSARCERFESFIDEVTCGDRELARFLRKSIGYGLLGDKSQECLFILYGATTRNGKGTLMETLLKVAGDYGVTSNPEFLASHFSAGGDRPSEQIARLKGKRLNNISEPPKQLVLDGALIKRLTGGDTVTARFLNENSFEFENVSKVFINTNYLPVVNDMTLFDSGRIKLIPFNRHFGEEEQDRTLKARFAEPENLSGILNWCVTGVVDYLDEGLKMPQASLDAIASYSKESDLMSNFLNDMVTADKDGEIKTSVLYKDYKLWCRDNGYEPENQSAFKSSLQRFFPVMQKRPKIGGNPTTMVCNCRYKDYEQTNIEELPNPFTENLA